MKTNIHKEVIAFIITFIVLIILILLYILLDFTEQENNEITQEVLINKTATVTNIWIYDYTRLDKLKENDIKYLLIDIGGTNQDGSFNNSYEIMYDFYDYIREYEENRNYSFILLPYSEVRSTEIDITTNEFKNNFVKSYKNLINYGYDGLLVDIEPVKKEEREDFLNILDKLNNELPNNSIIAVYTSHLVKEETSNVWEWEKDFYNQVIEKADIISAPLYDTIFTNTQEYQRHINKQIKLLNELKETEILIAIPTHKTYPEQSDIALEGILEAIKKHPNKNIVGITVFAEWTAENSDWENFKTYRTKIINEQIKK